MKTILVCDFQDEMRNHPDVSVAMEVQSAITEAISARLIDEKDVLTVRALSEIRTKIYENARKNSDPLGSLLAVMIGNNANPTEAALQLVEKRARAMQ